MPRSVIGRLISGSLTVARAALTCSRVGVLMMPKPRWWRASPYGVGLRLVVVGPVALLEVAEQGAQLGAQEVAGGDLADRHPQRGHLAGEELHVGVGAGVGLAVLLGDHLVAGLLPVLREQDQRRGVRRLQAEHQRQEDERVVVEPQASGASRFQPTQMTTNPSCRAGTRGAHEPRELLGEDAERVRVVRRAAHQRRGAVSVGVSSR